MSRYTIIDEADEMVSPDWVEDMKQMGGGILTIHTTNFVDTDCFQILTTTTIMCI